MGGRATYILEHSSSCWELVGGRLSEGRQITPARLLVGRRTTIATNKGRGATMWHWARMVQTVGASGCYGGGY
jgi:hypothetical protein